MTNIVLYNNVLTIHDGGSLSAVGAAKTLCSTQLASSLYTNVSAISTINNTSSWDVGDSIVIIPPNDSNVTLTDLSYKKIATKVNSNVFTINSLVTYNKILNKIPSHIDHIYNLSKQVKISGVRSKDRGAIRVIKSGATFIKNIEFSNFGYSNDITRRGIVYATDNSKTHIVESCSVNGDGIGGFLLYYPTTSISNSFSLIANNNIVYNTEYPGLTLQPYTTTIPITLSATNNRFINSNVTISNATNTNSFLLSGNHFISNNQPACIVDFRWLKAPTLTKEIYYGNRSYALSAANLIDMSVSNLTATYNDVINQSDIGVLYFTNSINFTATDITSQNNYYYGMHYDKVYHSSHLLNSNITKNLVHNLKIDAPNSLSLSSFNIKNVETSNAYYNNGIYYNGTLNLNIDSLSARNNPYYGTGITYKGNASVTPGPNTINDIIFTSTTSTGSTYIDSVDNYVVVPDNTRFAHGSRSYTYEAYVYLSNTNGAKYIFDTRSSTQPDELFLYNYYGTLYAGNTNTIWPSFGPIAANKWQHVALCRDTLLSKYSANMANTGYITVNNDIDITAGDFTVECYVLFTSNNIGYQAIFARNNAAAGDYAASFIVYIERTNVFSCAMTTTGGGWTNGIGTTIVPQINTWYHVALTKQGNIVTLWIDGAAAGSSTLTAPLYNVNQSWSIGGYRNAPPGFSTIYLAGYMSGFRIVAGTALYTTPGPFPVPTTPPTAVPGTQLLLNFNDPTVPKSTYWFSDTSGLNRATSFTGNVTPVSQIPFTRVFVNGIQQGINIIDTYRNKSLQLTLGSRFNGQEFLDGYINQVRVHPSAIYPASPVPALQNLDYATSNNIFLSISSSLLTSNNIGVYLNNINATTLLRANNINISNNIFAKNNTSINANNIAGHIDNNTFSSSTVKDMNISIGNKTTIFAANTSFISYGSLFMNVYDSLNYHPTTIKNTTIVPSAGFDLYPGYVSKYTYDGVARYTSWPAEGITLWVSNPAQTNLPRPAKSCVMFYIKDPTIKYIKVFYGTGYFDYYWRVFCYIDDISQGYFTQPDSTVVAIPDSIQYAQDARKITISFERDDVETGTHNVIIQGVQYSTDGITFNDFNFSQLYYDAGISYANTKPENVTGLYATRFDLIKLSNTNFKQFKINNTYNIVSAPLYVTLMAAPVLGSYIANTGNIIIDQASVRNYYQLHTEKHTGITSTVYPNVATYYRNGTISTDNTIATNEQQNAPSELLQPNTGARNKLKSARKYVAVRAGEYASVYTFAKQSKTYNGTPPRLMVSKNYTLGIANDIKLDEINPDNEGYWQILKGTTPAVLKDGVLEFYVDCDGTAGSVAIDRWAAPTT